MTATRIVDARGLSCPEPTLLAQRALRRQSEGRIEVLVDSGTARENVARLAAGAGWTVAVEPGPEGGERLVLTR